MGMVLSPIHWLHVYGTKLTSRWRSEMPLSDFAITGWALGPITLTHRKNPTNPSEDLFIAGAFTIDDHNVERIKSMMCAYFADSFEVDVSDIDILEYSVKMGDPDVDPLSQKVSHRMSFRLVH